MYVYKLYTRIDAPSQAYTSSQTDAHTHARARNPDVPTICGRSQVYTNIRKRI